jgi:DNA-binding response OmpR family regulator
MIKNDLKASDIPHSILIVVDEAAKAARLKPVLAAEGYQLEVVQSLKPPLPSLSIEPDLGIIWFPYSSTDALPELENIILEIQALGKAAPLPILLILDQYGTHWVEPSFKLGITDILTRPIHPLVLRHRVRLLLQSLRTERLIEELKRREAVLLQRQRMIAALDSALHVLRTESSSEAVADISGSLVKSSSFNIGDHILFDTEQRCLIFELHDHLSHRTVELTVDQAAILTYFIHHPHHALSNREIAHTVLGYDHLDEFQSCSIVRPHVLRLRRKLEEDSNRPTILRTIRGAGYVFSPD